MLIARLYDRIDALEVEKKAAHKTIAELTRKANRFRERFELVDHELTEHRCMLFGAKSERIIETPPEQPSMFPSNAAPHSAPKVRTMKVIRRVPTKKKQPTRQGLAAHLSRKVIRLDVPKKDREGCVQMNVRISEVYRHQPAKLYVVRYERPQYVDPKDPSRGVKIAPLPPRILPKANAGPDLLAHVVVNKYVDHLPLYRQAQRFARAGVPLSRSTLGGWVRLPSEELAPLPEALHKEVIQCDYLQIDSVQGRKKKGKTHRVYLAPRAGLLYVDYHPSRSRDGPSTRLAGYAGALQTDGYAVYQSAFGSNPQITLYGCWAHACRYFYKARDIAPVKELARQALRRIHGLYKVERRLRAAGGGRTRMHCSILR